MTLCKQHPDCVSDDQVAHACPLLTRRSISMTNCGHPGTEGAKSCLGNCTFHSRAAETESSEDAWTDKPIPEDDAIRAAHPTRTGRHDLYAEAMRLVGAKHSKGALVDLVNWLLSLRSQP